MNRREAVQFLFTITRAIQHSFISPVILFTHKDYAESIFYTFVNIRLALLEHAPPEKVTEIVFTFHAKWLEAIQDVEKFKKRIKETPRDIILKAIDHTTECTKHRYNNLYRYIDKLLPPMWDEDKKIIQADLVIMKEMQEIVNSALLEKKAYIRTQADQTEYLTMIHDEIEELMYWLDRLNDNLAMELCKLLKFKVPLAPCDLTKTLRQIIDEVAADPTPEAQRIAELIHVRGRLLSSAIRISSLNELEIAKVVEKIRALEDRISRLKVHNSSALTALKHKTLFLEERLQSLEDIKMSLWQLRRDSAGAHDTEVIKQHKKEMHIFNHLLPHRDRCRLVEKLMQLWNSALVEHDHESIISILSVADLKEIFSDERGTFTVDKYGRKLYSSAFDNEVYQLNEHNELVPLKDDDKHVYFYDMCGRYYINALRERIYKDHDGASEYILSKCGNLVKILEKIDGVDYYYDWLGRYYIDHEERQIYCDSNSENEYEHDGLGNLVKIHKDPFNYEPCPTEPMTQEENKYLQREVGEALKKCIAEVVMHQPSDPVAYLADRLEKYSDSIKEHEKHLKLEQERFELSRLIHTTKENTPDTVTEVEQHDYNFTNYEHEASSLHSSY